MPDRGALIGQLPRSWAGVTALALLLGLAPAPAAAHEGGELGMEVLVERIAAGDRLPIIGVDWAPTEVLEIRLQQGTDVTTIGHVRTGRDGHFLTSVQVPASVPAGPVAVDVVSTVGVRVRGVVTIDPDAPAATFTLRPGQLAGDPSSVAAEGGVDPVPILTLLGALGGLAVLFLRTGRRRAPGSPTPPG